MKLLLAALLVTSGAAPGGASPRVASLDQCSDQYVLALAEPSDVAFLSPRARAADSWLKDRARGLALRRPSIEAVAAARPAVVVRQWAGGPRLEAAMTRLGVRTVTVEDTASFDGIARNVRTVAAALGRRDRGERLVDAMNGKLMRARGAWRGAGAVYLTDGAFTAGPGTLVNTIMTSAGLTNLARAPGYAPAPLERLMLSPPKVVVFGRFDAPGHGRWSPVKGPVVHKALAGSRTVELPGSLLACPAWFAADAVEQLAAAAPP